MTEVGIILITFGIMEGGGKTSKKKYVQPWNDVVGQTTYVLFWSPLIPLRDEH